MINIIHDFIHGLVSLESEVLVNMFAIQGRTNDLIIVQVEVC